MYLAGENSETERCAVTTRLGVIAVEGDNVNKKSSKPMNGIVSSGMAIFFPFLYTQFNRPNLMSLGCRLTRNI